MDLEMRKADDDFSHLEYIYPLEEVICNRSTDFEATQVPTEQGELLLRFIMRHLFTGRLSCKTSNLR